MYIKINYLKQLCGDGEHDRFMPNQLKTIIFISFLCLLSVNNIFAETAHYTGTMKIIETSGRACGVISAKTYPLTMMFRTLKNGEITGFFEAEGITLGKFAGRYPGTLPVTYPYHDKERSSGHTIDMHENGSSFTVNLHDRHISPEQDECNFDRALMTLNRTAVKAVEAKFDAVAVRYDAQLIRSEAIDLSRKGELFDAVLRYEKALKLIDTVFPAGSPQRDSFSAALAGSYIRSDMTDEFIKLYNERFYSLNGDATRAIFNEYRIRVLKKKARTALQRDDFEAAIKNYQQAYNLNSEDKSVIAGMMSAYMRSERYEEAISFLAAAEKGFKNKEDRGDIRGAAAMALLKQSIKLDQSGKSAEAERSLKRAMEFDPDSALYTVALARLRHKTTGNLAAAEKMLNQAEAKYKDVTSRILIGIGREKMRQVDAILKKINGTDS